MAVDLCSDGLGSWAVSSPSLAGSPRLSFSRDLPDAGGTETVDGADVERTDTALLLGSPSSEFDFGVCHDDGDASPSSGPAAADELFADGMLLPIPIQPKKQKQMDDVASPVLTNFAPHMSPPSPPPPPPPPPPSRETLKEIMAANPDPTTSEDAGLIDARKPARHSFWGFRRSSSLSCVSNDESNSCSGNSSRYGGLFFSLPLLRRTKSAGCEPSRAADATAKTSRQRQRRATSTKAKTATGNPTPRRKSNVGAPRPPTSSSSSSSTTATSSSSSSSSASTYYYGPYHMGAASGGMRISPVINVPPACVHRGGSGGFLGLGHLFLCSGGKKSVVAADQ